MKFDRTKTTEALLRVIQRAHYWLEIVYVRSYAAYPLSVGKIEEMMAEGASCNRTFSSPF